LLKFFYGGLAAAVFQLVVIRLANAELSSHLLLQQAFLLSYYFDDVADMHGL
jgi:hypothetical protein